MENSFPFALKRPKEITQHGLTRVDDYFWLRYKEDPEVIKYLRAESDYVEEVMQHTKPLQEMMFEEMKGRIKENDSTVPEKDGDYFYYTRYETGKQYPLYCRKKGSLEAEEEILLDHNAVAEGMNFCRIGAFRVSPDGTTLAYSIDPDGSEKCVLYVKDLISGEMLPDTILNTFGSVYVHSGVEWMNDGMSFIYMILDAAQRPYRIYRHILGTDVSTDMLLYEESDDTYFLWLVKSRSDAYILAFSHSTITNEWRFLPTDGSSTEFKVFQTRQVGHEYAISHHKDKFFILSNENAQNFKLMETPVEETTKENWSEVIPHRPDVFIEDLDTFEDFIVLYERRDGFNQIRISDPDGFSNVRYVPFPEPVYAAYQTANPEFKTDILRFKYSSLITPVSVIDYHVRSGEWEVKKWTRFRADMTQPFMYPNGHMRPRQMAPKCRCPLSTKRA